LNLCVNYHGQEEIVDACKLIARQIKAGVIESKAISKELIKENLYSSYFLAPDLLVKTGLKRSWSSLLLWDSSDANYYHVDKPFNDLTEADMSSRPCRYVESD